MATYTTDRSLTFRMYKESLQIKKKLSKLKQTLQKRKYTNKLANINLAVVRKMQIKTTIIIVFHAFHQKSKN